MPETRIHCNTSLSPGAEFELPAEAARHAGRVLRLRPGMALTLFHGRGGEFDAEITQVRGRAVTVRTGEYRDVERESPLNLCLIQGISRTERMDWVIQKAVELGVARVAPVFTERSVVRLGAERAAKRLQHWQGIAIAACEQCGRNRIPAVEDPVALNEWMANRGSGLGGLGNALLLQPGAERSLADIQYTGETTTLLAGPEGGLAPAEVERAIAVGFVPVSLGPRILRTETAAIAALAAIGLLWGDL